MDVPLTLTVMAVVAELVGIEFHQHSLRLTRLQRHTGKALQLNGTQRLAVVSRRQVNLCHFVGSHLTCILHLEGEVHILIGRLGSLVQCHVLVFKGGIAQAIAEGPLDAGIRLGSIVVADCFIDFSVRIADRQLGRR